MRFMCCLKLYNESLPPWNYVGTYTTYTRYRVNEIFETSQKHDITITYLNSSIIEEC